MAINLKKYTRPGQPTLKKCPDCEQWRGILGFKDDHNKTRKRCRACREK